MINYSNKKAFTLAEVLITLGIIGVVASMTIPTLIQNYNERVWRTGAEVFNRKLEEALKTMNTQQTLAGHTTTESFVEELSKHFKTNKICQNDELLDCFSETVYWGGGNATPEEIDMSIIKTAKNFGQDDWNTNIVGVLFANGVSALIAYNPTTGEKSCTQDPYSNQITGGDCLAILYDTSANKNPNTSGKDLRANGNVTKLGQACAFEIDGTCYVTMPFSPEPHVWNACNSTGVTSDEDDLAFMNTYGISKCMNSFYGTHDYWAGAVKTCGGLSKMPTMAQIAKLANYIYGVSNISASSNKTSLSMNTQKTASLGFELDNSNTFYLWSNEEGTAATASGRQFSSTGTWTYLLDRNNSTAVQAVCISN